MYEEIKENIKKVIEDHAKKNGGLQHWIKDEMINVLDIQISEMPTLKQDMYTFLINSAEHPNGYKLSLSAHPVLRIREGLIVRDPSRDNKPDTFFWEPAQYEKMKGKSVYYKIGTETGEYLEAYANLRARLKFPKDGKEFSFLVASAKYPFEVMETPAEDRIAFEVDEELLKQLPSIVESYNDWDKTDVVALKVGDLLVLDNNGYYYRVEKSLKEQTYHKGE